MFDLNAFALIVKMKIILKKYYHTIIMIILKKHLKII